MMTPPSEPPSRISALPIELLLRIFHIACCEQDARDFPLPYPQDHRLPWRLLLVCSLWRHIVINHASLWSTLAIYVSNRLPKVDGCCTPPLRTLSLWMERSGSHPLTLMLGSEFPGCQFGFPEDIPAETLRFIHENIQRTEILYLRTSEVFDDSDSDEAVPLPSLHDSSLLSTPRADDEKQAPREPITPLCPSDFPYLKQFNWIGSSTRFVRYPIPWAHLELLSLSVDGILLSPKICLDLLKETTSLVSFGASIMESFDPAYEGDPVTVANLTRLGISGTPYAFAQFFRYVRLRHLKFLDLKFCDPYDEEFDDPGQAFENLYPQIESLLVENQPTLESLVFSGLYIASSKLLRLLQIASPTLTDLDISVTPLIDGEVLTALTISDEAASLCPRLLNLALYSCLAAPGGCLATMVESRCISFPLSNLTVALPRFTTPEDLPRLNALHSRGQLPYFNWVDEAQEGNF